MGGPINLGGVLQNWGGGVKYWGTPKIRGEGGSSIGGESQKGGGGKIGGRPKEGGGGGGGGRTAADAPSPGLGRGAASAVLCPWQGKVRRFGDMEWQFRVPLWDSRF